MIYLPVTNVWPFRLIVMFSFYKTDVKCFIYKHLEVYVQNQRVGMAYLCVCVHAHDHMHTRAHMHTCANPCLPLLFSLYF